MRVIKIKIEVLEENYKILNSYIKLINKKEG